MFSFLNKKKHFVHWYQFISFAIYVRLECGGQANVYECMRREYSCVQKNWFVFFFPIMHACVRKCTGIMIIRVLYVCGYRAKRAYFLLYIFT